MLVSRRLMDPDPRAPLPSLASILWLFVFVLGVVVTLTRFAT